MAGKTSGTCSQAAPLSRPVDAGQWARRAAEPVERPGKHKSNTRATQEEHKRAIRYPPAIPWLATGLCLACAWLVPRATVALERLCPAFLHFAFCLRLGWLWPASALGRPSNGDCEGSNPARWPASTSPRRAETQRAPASYSQFSSVFHTPSSRCLGGASLCRPSARRNWHAAPVSIEYANPVPQSEIEK